jgi:osmotically-inducible protein OsmY
MTDNELGEQVEHALDWEPSLDSRGIGVTVHQGVVTLRGNVASYPEKVTAEKVALLLYGTRAVANDLVVVVPHAHHRTDPEVAAAAAEALNDTVLMPNGRVTVSVTNGWMTLDGAVNWQYQKAAAARAVRDLIGIRGITNRIRIEPAIHPADVSEKIEAAFKRSAEIDARRIHVTTDDGKVTLTGHVRSWVERQEAARAAWAAPGVRVVDDRLLVVP